MAKIIKAEAKCRNCGEYFAAPIVSSTDEEFVNSTTIFENLMTCPHCQQSTQMDKTDMRLQLEDGTFKNGTDY